MESFSDLVLKGHFSNLRERAESCAVDHASYSSDRMEVVQRLKLVAEIIRAELEQYGSPYLAEAYQEVSQVIHKVKTEVVSTGLIIESNAKMPMQKAGNKKNSKPGNRQTGS